MTRHPIDAHVDPRRGDHDEARQGVTREAFREALSHWASTVTVVAARDGDHVHATTVTSFFPVSLDPPLVAVSLGPNAQVLPWLDEDARFVVSFLEEGQRALASRFADSYPVGPSPFPASGDPVVEGSVGALACAVRQVWETEGGTRLVIGRVEALTTGSGTAPLLYYRRGYRGLSHEE
ncbi:MAG: flavin reductase family protein [Gemmatimonadetes bacterium]|nr:flavin reductase family protein [Gemmatimonadota bacterium]